MRLQSVEAVYLDQHDETLTSWLCIISDRPLIPLVSVCVCACVHACAKSEVVFFLMLNPACVKLIFFSKDPFAFS